MDDATQKLAAEAWAFRAGYEAAQRPQASPEVRDAIRAEVKRTLNVHRGVAGHHKLSEILTDAILARFSFLSQPVYDEEKIARAIKKADEKWYAEPDIAGHGVPVTEWSKYLAAALVAALRGGELTREEEKP